MSGIAFVVAPVAGVWLMIGYWLGQKQTEMGGDSERPSATGTATA